MLAGDAGDHITQIVVATLGLGGIFTTAYFAYLASSHAKVGAEQARIGAQQATIGAQQSTQTNDAVNHHHESGHDRLFDIVVDTRNQVAEVNQWKERWDGLPEQIGSADALTTHFAVIEDRITTSTDAIHRRVGRLDEQNALQHEAIVDMLKDHIDDEAPKMDALVKAVDLLETKAEAETRNPTEEP